MKNMNDFVIRKIVDILVQENWEVQVNQTTSISRSPWTPTEDQPVSPRDHDEDKVCFQIFKPKSAYFPMCITFYGLEIAFEAEWRDVGISFENTVLDEQDYPDMVYMMSMTPVLVNRIKMEFKRWAKVIDSEIQDANFRQRNKGEGLRKWKEDIGERMKERTSPYIAGASPKQDRLEVECFLAYHLFQE